MTRTPLVAATKNLGKVRELHELFAELPFELIGLNAFGDLPDVDETGSTFFENAELKASAYAQLTGHWCLSDDSGLEVDALGGAPGVQSARYGGKRASESKKIRMLLDEMRAVGRGNRAARFVCAMAVADAAGKIIVSTQGICEGRIADEPRGKSGFGYDPIFIPNLYSETFAELSGTVKAKISHRAAAASEIMVFFRNFAVNQLDQSSFRL